MKRRIKIVLIISLIINVFIVAVKIINAQRNKYESPKIKEVDIQSERAAFFENLKKSHPDLANKKYFFINIWAPGDWDSMHQMPLLDTVVEPLKNNFAYLFVSEDENDYAERRLKEHSAKTNNFAYINEQKGFVTSIFQEKKMPSHPPFWGRMTPMNLIMDPKGKILYFDTLHPLSGITYDFDSNKGVEKKLTEAEKISNQKYKKTLDSAFKLFK